jgi:hypothetical protein
MVGQAVPPALIGWIPLAPINVTENRKTAYVPFANYRIACVVIRRRRLLWPWPVVLKLTLTKKPTCVDVGPAS